MALDLDLSRQLRGIDGRRDLVRAIVNGHPSDESVWLEWKTDPGLRTKRGCFHIAKAILGMANRPVEVAARHCGGHGYIVVGVEPDNLSGVDMPDPAEWIDSAEIYLKGEIGPSWECMIVPMDGKDILVVTVDPPLHGDPPWPLRKEFDTYRSGLIFVRKQGKTEPALAEDVDALGRRAASGGSQIPELLIEVIGDVPLPWLVGAEISDQVEVWAQDRRDQRLRAAHAVEDERSGSARSLEAADPLDTLGLGGSTFLAQHAGLLNAAADAQSVFSQYEIEPDKRSIGEYTAELDAWLDELLEAASNDLLRRYCDNGHGLVQLRVENNSTQYLPGVELKLHIPLKEAQGFASVPEGDDIPRPPWPFGKPKQRPSIQDTLLAGGSVPFIPTVGYDREIFRDTTIEDGSIRVTLDAGDLRPRADYRGDAFYIFLPLRPPDGLLHMSWTATVKNRDGMIEGQMAVPIQEIPIDVSDVLPS